MNADAAEWIPVENDLIHCPHCGELIVSFEDNAAGKGRPRIRLRFQKHIALDTPKPKMVTHHWDGSTFADGKPYVYGDMKQTSGKCPICNISMSVRYLVPYGAQQPKEHKPPKDHVQRWEEKGTQLRCECGEQVGYLEIDNSEENRKARRILQKLNPMNEGLSSANTTLHKENLDAFVPPETYEQRQAQEIDDPFEEITPFPEYYLCLRLKFHCKSKGLKTGFMMDMAEEQYNKIVRGLCLKCGISHVFTSECREGILLRWVEICEKRKKQTKRA